LGQLVVKSPNRAGVGRTGRGTGVLWVFKPDLRRWRRPSRFRSTDLRQDCPYRRGYWDFACAISIDCPGRPGGTQHQCGADGGDIPCCSTPDHRAGCRKAVGHDGGKTETVAGTSDNGDRSSGGSESGFEPSTGADKSLGPYEQVRATLVYRLRERETE
jgi:hypothetical protein